MSVRVASIAGLIAGFSLCITAGAAFAQTMPASADRGPVVLASAAAAPPQAPLVVRSPLVIEPKDPTYRVRARAVQALPAPEAPPAYRAPPPPPSAHVPPEAPLARAPQPEPPPARDRARKVPVQNEPDDGEQGSRVDLAQTRMLQNVPDDIEGYFDLFMYVSKANRGPMGQRMFLFERDQNGELTPYAEWRVSTGREQWEERNGRRTFTATPEGVFRLDPDRFHKEYYSRTYDNAPMPYAMFFDMQTRGYPTGLAIHAAASASKIARLGRRDSGGCVRLSPKNAKELFYKIRNTHQGMVPVFASPGGSTDRWGKVARDGSGNIRLTEGYKALLMIEDFDGRGMIGPVVAFTH